MNISGVDRAELRPPAAGRQHLEPPRRPRHSHQPQAGPPRAGTGHTRHLLLHSAILEAVVLRAG